MNTCLFLLFSVFFFFSVPSLEAHPDFEAFPECTGAATLLAPDKLAETHFFPDSNSISLFKKIRDIQAQLEKNKLSVRIDSITAFQTGFLIRSNAGPATVRYILKYKLLSDKLVWEETKPAPPDPAKGKDAAAATTVAAEKQPSFTVTNSNKDTFLVTFPKEHYILVSARTASPEKGSSDCKMLLKETPDDVALAFLWPNPGKSPEYPLMGELKSVSLYVKYLKGKARPVYAEIVMPAKSDEAALKITNACKAYFEKIYADASKLGKIPEDMKDAFTVSSAKDITKIHISLTEENAKVFLALFLTNLHDTVAPLELSEKFR